MTWKYRRDGSWQTPTPKRLVDGEWVTIDSGDGGGDGEDDYNSDGEPQPNADGPFGIFDGDVPDQEWSLDAADDFTEASLGETNWQIGFGWGGRSHGSTEEYVRNEDVWLDTSDDRLVMQTLPDEEAGEDAPGDDTWFGGAANTLGNVEGHVGYWEASIKMPEPTEGFVPGFWTRGAEDLSGGTGHPPEVDFVERFGEYPEGRTTAGTVHYDDPRQEDGIREDQGIVLSENYHVYGCLWTDSYCQFFFDGKLCESSSGKTATTSEAHGTEPYHLESQIHYAIFTNHVWPSSWNGYPDTSVDYPVFTKIDWFRRWEF